MSSSLRSQVRVFIINREISLASELTALPTILHVLSCNIVKGNVKLESKMLV